MSSFLSSIFKFIDAKVYSKKTTDFNMSTKEDESTV